MAWQVGVLSLKFPLVSFQEKSETAYETLLALVKEQIGSSATLDKQTKNKQNEHAKNMSFTVSHAFLNLYLNIYLIVMVTYYNYY